MGTIEIIQKLKGSTFTSEDGDPYTIDFEPGLTEEQLESLKVRFPGNTIADELREVLRETRGWEYAYGVESAYFDSIGDFGFTELNPHAITLGNDGFGNAWVLDIRADGTLGKIYYACHDPAVHVIYCDTLNEYFRILAEHFSNPRKNYLQHVEDKVVMDIWSTNPNIVDIVDFRRDHEHLAPFLQEFIGDHWVVADLRQGAAGSGFAWGKFGSNEFTRRHPTELVWVMQKKKKGLLSRLFG